MPVGIHFLISQMVGNSAYLLFTRYSADPMNMFYQYTVVLTGLTGLLALIPAVWLYRRDSFKRRMFSVPPQIRSTWRKKELFDIPVLLVMGAGLSLYGNFLTGILQIFLKSETYRENITRITDGKSLFMLIFWMGIVASTAEETIFRWLVFLRLRESFRLPAAAVISGLIFGIYHGNIEQAFYATLLGTVFAYLMELTGNLWSSVLLHIGANIWSLVLSENVSVFLESKAGTSMFSLISLVLLAVVFYGFAYFRGKRINR